MNLEMEYCLCKKLIKPMEYIRIEDYNVIIYEINIFNYLDIFIHNIEKRLYNYK